MASPKVDRDRLYNNNCRSLGGAEAERWCAGYVDQCVDQLESGMDPDKSDFKIIANKMRGGKPIEKGGIDYDQCLQLSRIFTVSNGPPKIEGKADKRPDPVKGKNAASGMVRILTHQGKIETVRRDDPFLRDKYILSLQKDSALRAAAILNVKASKLAQNEKSMLGLMGGGIAFEKRLLDTHVAGRTSVSGDKLTKIYSESVRDNSGGFIVAYKERIRLNETEIYPLQRDLFATSDELLSINDHLLQFQDKKVQPLMRRISKKQKKVNALYRKLLAQAERETNLEKKLIKEMKRLQKLTKGMKLTPFNLDWLGVGVASKSEELAAIAVKRRELSLREEAWRIGARLFMTGHDEIGQSVAKSIQLLDDQIGVSWKILKAHEAGNPSAEQLKRLAGRNSKIQRKLKTAQKKTRKLQRKKVFPDFKKLLKLQKQINALGKALLASIKNDEVRAICREALKINGEILGVNEKSLELQRKIHGLEKEIAKLDAKIAKMQK